MLSHSSGETGREKGCDEGHQNTIPGPKHYSLVHKGRGLLHRAVGKTKNTRGKHILGKKDFSLHRPVPRMEEGRDTVCGCQSQQASVIISCTEAPTRKPRMLGMKTTSREALCREQYQTKLHWELQPRSALGQGTRDMNRVGAPTLGGSHRQSEGGRRHAQSLCLLESRASGMPLLPHRTVLSSLQTSRQTPKK